MAEGEPEDPGRGGRKGGEEYKAGPDVGALRQKLEVLTPQFPKPEIHYFSLSCETYSIDSTRKPTVSPSFSCLSRGLPILSLQGKTFQECTRALRKFPCFVKALLVERRKCSLIHDDVVDIC